MDESDRQPTIDTFQALASVLLRGSEYFVHTSGDLDAAQAVFRIGQRLIDDLDLPAGIRTEHNSRRITFYPVP